MYERVIAIQCFFLQTNCLPETGRFNVSFTAKASLRGNEYTPLRLAISVFFWRELVFFKEDSMEVA